MEPMPDPLAQVLVGLLLLGCSWLWRVLRDGA
jgi:hypothetical protein